MKNDEVTIVIDFKIYLYLFEPIIRYLLQKNVKIYLAAPQDIMPEVKDILGGLEVTFVNLSEIKSKNKFRFYFHRTIATLCTRQDFSFQYKKKRQQTTKKAAGMQGILLKIARFTPKVSNKKINAFLHKVSGIGLKNPFPTNKIMVGSLNASAELLTSKTQKVITVMESWDHSVKHPNGYRSDLFLGWNNSLCEDWKITQGDLNVEVFHPLKLRYAHETFRWESKRNTKLKVLYPVASTKKFSIDILVQIEKKIIQELVHVTKKLDWGLVIKPRPNGLDGEFDYLLENDHVKVANVSHGNITNPANYYFTEKDNYDRFSLLEEINLVINAFTTFGLDSIAVGVPVLQLDLRKCESFEDSHMVYSNHHIEKYLISSDDLIRPVDTTLYAELYDKKDILLEVAEKYTNKMRHWLYKYKNTEDAMRNCFSKIDFTGKTIK